VVYELYGTLDLARAQQHKQALELTSKQNIEEIDGDGLIGYFTLLGEIDRIRKSYECALEIYRALGNMKGESTVISLSKQVDGLEQDTKNNNKMSMHSLQDLQKIREPGVQTPYMSYLFNMQSAYAFYIAQNFERAHEYHLIAVEKLKLANKENNNIYDTVLLQLETMFLTREKRKRNEQGEFV